MPAPATLPDWISLDGAVGDLTALLPELATYAALARHWREISAAIWKLGADAPVDSPARLVLYLADKIEDPAIVSVFDELDLGTLHADLVALKARLADPNAPLGKLLRPVADFGAADAAETPPDEGFGFDAGPDDGEIALKLPKLAANAAGTRGPTSLTFDLGASGQLACEAGAPWPFRRDGVAGGLLRIGGEGKVTTRAGLSLPFGQVGTGTASAGASVEAAMSLLFRPSEPAQPYAEALADALTALPEPLDLNAVSHAMTLAGMEGMAFGCDGAVDAGLGIVLGKGIDIPGAVSGTIGITANIAFKRDARWILSLRRVGKWMRFVLSRDDLRERNWSAGVDIRLDATPLARHVHDALIAAQDFTGPVLAQIKPFLSPGTYLATQAADLLDTAAKSIVGQDDIRAALVADLSLALGSGTATESALAKLLGKKVADVAATHADGVFAGIDAWTKHVVEGLTRDIPGLAATGVGEALSARVAPLLDDVQARFKALVGQLTSTDAASKALARELSAAGVKVKQTETDADALFAGVRDAVEKFNAFAAQVIDATSERTSKKLQARFGWSGTDSASLKYELSGIFSETNSETAALWRALMTGQLQPFQRMLADPALAPAGLQLAPESSLSRFASKERGFALEIVVLGVELSIASIVKGTASITTNAAGDIVVVAEGSALRKVEGFDEGRSAKFVGTWDLLLAKADAAAGNRRTMGVSLNFDHNDKDLKAPEVEALLGGLRDQGLIDPARVGTALGIYQDWRVKAATTGKVRGRIGLDVRLPDTAIQRMVAIGRDLNRKDNRTLIAVFDAATRIQLAAGVASQKQFDRDLVSAQDNFTISSHADNPVAYLVALSNSRVDLLPSNGGIRLPALAQIIPRAAALAALLRTMAEIYDALPVGAEPGSGWTESQYADAEKRMAASARSWLRLNQNFIFWFKASLHPALLAFLRLLVGMSRPVPASGRASDGLDTPLDLRVSDVLFQISMTASDGKTVTPV